MCATFCAISGENWRISASRWMATTLCSSLRLSSTMRGAQRIEVGQNQGDGLRMLGVEQLAELLRIGALQLGQIALRRLLRTAHQHQQIVGALLAEGVHQQAAGVVQAAVDHEVLRLEQLPELLHDLRRKLRRDAAQVGQLLGEPLHVGLRQRAQNLLGQLLADGYQQHRGLAQPRHAAPTGAAVVRCPDSLPVSAQVPCSLLRRLVGVNPALQQARALRRLALEMLRHLLVDLLVAHALRVRLRRLRAGRLPRPQRAAASSLALAGARGSGSAATDAAPDERRRPAPPAGRRASAAYLSSSGEFSAPSSNFSGKRHRLGRAIVVEGNVLNRQHVSARRSRSPRRPGPAPSGCAARRPSAAARRLPISW